MTIDHFVTLLRATDTADDPALSSVCRLNSIDDPDDLRHDDDDRPIFMPWHG